MPKDLLIIGSRRSKKDKTNIGGVVILFEQLLTSLEKEGVRFEVIDTLVENHGGKLKALCRSWRDIVLLAPKVRQISLHATRNGLVYLGFPVIVCGKLWRKKVSIRAFAGDMADKYEKANSIEKFLIRFTLRHADCVFFETKYLVQYFSRFNKNTFWFPNVRPRSATPTLPKRYKKRFVYIGTINEEKGIDDLIEVIEKLPKDYTVDLYGPIIEEKYSETYFASKKINYKGPLEPDRVLQTMDRYDVLVLPSYREGYPGVIIEAFMMGLPVIATALEGIKEMVEDNRNGLLVEPGDIEALESAIRSIDETSYEKLHANALRSFSQYDNDEKTNFFLKTLGISDE